MSTTRYLSNAKYELIQAYDTEKANDPASGLLKEIDNLIVRVTKLESGEVSITAQQKQTLMEDETWNVYISSRPESNVILAVKYYRAKSGLSLRESKNAVERLIRERK